MLSGGFILLLTRRILLSRGPRLLFDRRTGPESQCARRIAWRMNKRRETKGNMMKSKVERNPTAEARLYAPTAFAKIICWHPESVRRAVRQGRIRALRLGNGWRIPSDEVRRICTAGLS